MSGILMLADPEWLAFHQRHSLGRLVIFYASPHKRIKQGSGVPLFCVRPGNLPRSIMAFGLVRAQVRLPQDEAWPRYRTALGARSEPEWRKQAESVLANSRRKYNGDILAIELDQLHFFPTPIDPGTVGLPDNGWSSRKEIDDQTVARLQGRLAPGVDRANALRAEGEAVVEPTFDPSDAHDARLRVLASLVRRQGQPAFRRELLRAYDGHCAITGCAVVDVLEAAHIVPYRGPQTNHVSNGLLLRSDLHALFDLHLLEIDPETYSVLIDPSLATTPYGEFHGLKIRLPADAASRPLPDCLRLHAQGDSMAGGSN
jgi:hypothetical protein